MALAAVVLALIGAHAWAFYRAWDSMSLPIVAVAGLAALVIAKHLGLAGALRAWWLRRRARR